MALSAPPPPPDASPPPTTAATATTASTSTPATTTTTTTHAARPPFPPNPRLPPPTQSHAIYPAPFYPPQVIHPPHLANPRLPSSPSFPQPLPHDVSTAAASPATTNSGILYPVASSGRGFIQKQQPSTVTVSNSNPNSHPFNNRSGVISYSRPLFGYPHPDPGQSPGMAMGMGYVSGRPAQFQQQGGVSGTMVFPGVINSVPVASSQGQRKISFSSAPNADSNGHKDSRGKSRDESLLTVRDRKVKMSESASIYALCRSWLKNGALEGNQPVYQDGARLPRPLPLSVEKVVSPAEKDDAKEETEEEGSVENLTPEELLQGHIKRAKKVRSW
ncbi:OLC1v1001658C1 [Oldenlandia corymbosa var. corymbosa]|uniref:OLC1v1001658C1 n=1 Tax=Oldenlandia corymbosa var. corymbosa TaxID=529605 RepID=A0AAV1D5T5_OLDCO|nr:OLC1v1001658C1 [Oldenlandia corymbosa var. corymbosa]